MLLTSLSTNVYLGLQKKDQPVMTQSPIEQIEVMRTKGGLLQVSTISSPEIFQSTQTHTLLGVPVGNTISQIRVPATYHYHIELAPEWKISLKDKTFTVITPRVKPTLPVAIDTAHLERLDSGTWSLFTGNAQLNELQKSITQNLALKAATPAFIALQREASRKTVTEFVSKWVLAQKRWEPSAGYTVRVFFTDEPIEALGI